MQVFFLISFTLLLSDSSLYTINTRLQADVEYSSKVPVTMRTIRKMMTFENALVLILQSLYLILSPDILQWCDLTHKALFILFQIKLC